MLQVPINVSLGRANVEVKTENYCKVPEFPEITGQVTQQYTPCSPQLPHPSTETNFKVKTIISLIFSS